MSLFGAWTTIQSMTVMYDKLTVLLWANKPTNMWAELQKQNQTRTARKLINAGTMAHTETTLAQHREHLMRHNTLLLIFLQQEKELTQI